MSEKFRKNVVNFMTTILRLDSSSRTDGSKSRQLGDYFEKVWLSRYPADQVIKRDLIANPINHISDVTIAGFYTPPEQFTDELREATALSDELIKELFSADVLLLTVPMYNFSVPSALKAWIDHIVRIGHTFSYDGTNFAGLVTGKRVYIVSAYGAGGYLKNGPMSAYDFMGPYLTLLFNFLGIENIQIFGAEATTADEETVKANVLAAQQEIDQALAGAAVLAS